MIRIPYILISGGIGWNHFLILICKFGKYLLNLWRIKLHLIMNKILKPILGTLAVAAIAAAGYFGTRAQDSDTSLLSLIQISDADAECGKFNVAPGRCLSLSGVCVYDTTEIQCSP